MDLIAVSDLQQSQLEDMKQLLKICWEHDSTYREPYLSNRLNFDKSMPVFVLAYEDNQLAGFLAAYADDHEPEISLYVHPEKRRHGLARRLYEKFQEVTVSYDLSNYYFVSETRFLENHPTLLAKWKLVLSEDKELLLERNRVPFVFEHREDLLVVEAAMEHIEGIADFKSIIFDTPRQTSLRYAREALADENSCLYIVLKEGRVVATCTVDLSSDDDYLYSLAVVEEEQGLGIGSYLVKYIVNERIATGNKRAFQIAVDTENKRAKSLYEKLGFEVKTEVVYLQFQS